MRRLLILTWLEIKIFVREPLGLIGTVGIPVVVFVVFGRIFGNRLSSPPPRVPGFVGTELPVLAAILMTLERRALAHHGDRDLPGGRDPQAAARHAAPALDDPDGSRAREADRSRRSR